MTLNGINATEYSTSTLLTLTRYNDQHLMLILFQECYGTFVIQDTCSLSYILTHAEDPQSKVHLMHKSCSCA